MGIHSNFREIVMGDIFPKTLYRSNHPVYDGKQDKEIILLAQSAKIKTIINLSDSIRTLKSKIMYCPWYKKMTDEKNVIALDISMRFGAIENDFLKKLKRGIVFMIKHNPPYLIHCEVGIDRTGFFAILLEAFMKAKFDDMAKDYMLSFVSDNNYSDDDRREGSIFALDFFSNINGGSIDTGDDLQGIAVKYLAEKAGLSNNELSLLKDKLKRV